MGNSQYSKDQLLEKFKMHANDTGSSLYQIFTLTEKINRIAKQHISIHKHDYPVKRSITRWVAQRRRLQRYLLRNMKDKATYDSLMQSIGLRG